MGTPIHQNTASSYGYSGQDEDLQLKKDKKAKPKKGTVEGYTEEQKARDAANAVKTSDTKAKSVRQGKLDREKDFDKAKDKIKATRKTEKEALKAKKKNLNIKENEASGQKTGYDDSSDKKTSRSAKRTAMRDVRNKERGAIRADRAARQIKKMGDRNNMTVGEATKAYEDRKATLSSYNKDAMKETATQVAERNEKIKADNDKARLLAEKSTGVVDYDFSNPSSNGVQAVVSGNDGTSPDNMLDAPTQQQATPDRSGPDLTSGRRGPGKFKMFGF